MKSLTSRQKEILDFLEHFSKTEGLPPTVREIGSWFKISPAGVFRHLKALERKGWIQKKKNHWRSNHLSKIQESWSNEILSVPILGRISAGLPVLSESNTEGYLLVDRNVRNGNSLFALKVKGDSMTGAGIHDGDFIIAKHQETVENGEIAVVLVDDETTVKRLRYEKKTLVLEPENPNFKPIHIKNEKCMVQGKVIALYRQITSN